MEVDPSDPLSQFDWTHEPICHIFFSPDAIIGVLYGFLGKTSLMECILQVVLLEKVKFCIVLFVLFNYLHHPSVNILRPRQNGRHFLDTIFKCIFLNENVWILIKVSLNLVPKGPINNIPALVHIMAWSRPGDKPLSKTKLVSLLMHICIIRPQWVKQC